MKKRKTNYTRPWIYPKQLDAIFHEQRYGLIEASTKTGKTVGCIVWLFEQALLGKQGYNYWWIAPVYAQAKIAYRRLKRYLPQAVYESNEQELVVRLPNGTTIWFKGADKPDSLYGEDVYACVIDEASRVKEDAWFAVRSTLTATRGPVRIIGNVKGRKNWFYGLCRKAENNEPGYHYVKLTAYDAAEAGILSYEEIEDAKRVLPPNVFNELYLAEPSDDGGNPFGISHIEACVMAQMSTNPVVCWGWDLAKSVDWTVGIGLDSFNQVAAFHRWQKPWNDTMQEIKRLTGTVPALVDSTGVGDPILEQLQRGNGSNFEGRKFTSASKQQMMEALASSIQAHKVKYPDGELYRELLEFEYEYTRNGVKYSAPSGMHDDCVIALALANLHAMRNPNTDTEYNQMWDRLRG